MALGIGTCMMAYRLGLGDLYNPGPGLIPFGVAALLCLMSLGLCLSSLFKVIKGSQERDAFKGIEWGRVVLVLCALLGYGVAFNFLGFRICTFLLMVLLFGVVGRLKWWLTIAISLFTVLCTYLIFEVWLGCSFPQGPLGM